MISIGISGSSGFVGKSVLEKNINLYHFVSYKKNQLFEINEDVVIHLAGKAHDFKNVSDSSEYYKVNTELTKIFFDSFLISNAKVFITLSSVKAVADSLESILTEEYTPNPITHYGKSKLFAEQYILSKTIPEGKRVYILRPCMIHGTGNKGNLNILFKIVSKGFPWPLGAFENKRSFCSIDNLCFLINELIINDSIPSGVYNIADDEPIATNDLIKLIAESQGKKHRIWNIPVYLIKLFSKIGDIIKLPLNTERLNKLTETYIVSNNKVKKAINKPLPFSAKEGLMKTLNSFNTNAK
ncbi:MAG: NAD-dependent epimerase/dehydratase family protein [Chitinophagia bacterium]